MHPLLKVYLFRCEWLHSVMDCTAFYRLCSEGVHCPDQVDEVVGSAYQTSGVKIDCDTAHPCRPKLILHRRPVSVTLYYSAFC
jgi:hypothetical protein